MKIFKCFLAAVATAIVLSGCDVSYESDTKQYMVLEVHYRSQGIAIDVLDLEKLQRYNGVSLGNKCKYWTAMEVADVYALKVKEGIPSGDGLCRVLSYKVG